MEPIPRFAAADGRRRALPPAAPVAGLLLAGGYSRRMGQDKASLDYHGRAQLLHAFELLQGVTAPCYLGIRADQRNDPLRRMLPCLIDAQGMSGPAAALLAGSRRLPAASWLLLACDMPLMTAAALRGLREAAATDSDADVIGYAASDGLLEPMCALWRPASGQRLQSMPLNTHIGLRRLAGSLRVRLLPAADSERLANANTPAEAERLRARLQGGLSIQGRADFME